MSPVLQKRSHRPHDVSHAILMTVVILVLLAVFGHFSPVH